MNQVDPNFDWVTARAKCSPEGVIASLKEQVESDVEKRNGLRSGTELQYDVKFEFVVGSEAFKVSRVCMGELLESAIFSRTKDGIKVVYHGKETNRSSIEAVLTLSSDQECKLRTPDREEHSFWQFRRLALEPVLFSLDMVGW